MTEKSLEELSRNKEFLGNIRKIEFFCLDSKYFLANQYQDKSSITLFIIMKYFNKLEILKFNCK